MNKLDGILNKIIDILIIIILLLAIYAAYVGINYFKDQTAVPYDDATTTAKDIICVGNTCNITFKYNVSRVLKSVVGSGSMVPLIGANDGVICLNKTPELGDIVIGTYFLHMVHRVEGDWVWTRGWNAKEGDPYKMPKREIECVVGTIIR